GRPEPYLAPATTVSWYENCVATLESVPARIMDADNRATGQNIAVGVMEHKFVSGHDGLVEVLVHGGP
ncbi:hypothetical protein, partial [Pseudomonas syringae group genomosp. 7]|uniref:hypothetical protein n=1 Tax=Pseudomonas syringae group genomosp. 7 TaxID=251699 RepID=UPI00376F7745